jgi:hypothetical protein
MIPPKIPYSIFSRFVLRTPVLSYNILLKLLSSYQDPDELLKNIASQPEVDEAIFLASPDFYYQLQKWKTGNEFDRKKNERIQQTLYKYISRMATRCTPFGLFAGCSVGNISDKTCIELGKPSQNGRYTRLDMHYLCNLSIALSKNKIIRNKLCYFPNTTIYECGQYLRYIESIYIEGKRTHNLVQVKKNKYISLVLRTTQKGALLININKNLVNEGIPEHLSIAYINELIDNQILINEISPIVTGTGFLERLIKLLDPIEEMRPINSVLSQVYSKLALIDKQYSNSIEQYLNIAEDLKSLNIEFELKYLFQTETNIKSSNAYINNGTTNSILKGIIALNKITDTGSKTNIQQFRDAFVHRYETREMPLLKVLDLETGIGYNQNNQITDSDISPLIEDIQTNKKLNESIKHAWGSFQQLLFNKLLDATAQNKLEIELTDIDFEIFDTSWQDLPITFSAMVKIIEAPSKNFPDGRLQIESTSGSSAASLLGRFCHGNKDIKCIVNDIIEKEQKLFPDVLLAEIAHLPESRVGNILFRPTLRQYEIPILTLPSVDFDHAITLDDLFISVKNGEIILRSKHLNKRIIPRLSNAHNYSRNAIPVYQFLCDLQNQNLRGWLGFNWGVLSNKCAFKPRVVFKNLIFSPATWIVKNREFKKITELKSKLEFLQAISKWKKTRNLPKYVLLTEDDTMLFVDLENFLSVKTLVSSVKGKRSFILKEFLFNPERAVVNGVDGPFLNEFVLSFYKNNI